MPRRRLFGEQEKRSRSARLQSRVCGARGVGAAQDRDQHRVMELILAAVAAQFVIDGLREAFAWREQEVLDSNTARGANNLARAATTLRRRSSYRAIVRPVVSHVQACRAREFPAAVRIESLRRTTVTPRRVDTYRRRSPFSARRRCVP